MEEQRMRRKISENKISSIQIDEIAEIALLILKAFSPMFFKNQNIWLCLYFYQNSQSYLEAVGPSPYQLILIISRNISTTKTCCSKSLLRNFSIFKPVFILSVLVQESQKSNNGVSCHLYQGSCKTTFT